MLSMEQETLRVHGRAARAMVNQQTPLSVCTILRDEEIYNTIESDHDKDKNVRSRYNGRQLLSWLQDVDDKYEKIKVLIGFANDNKKRNATSTCLMVVIVIIVTSFSVPYCHVIIMKLNLCSRCRSWNGSGN